MRRPGKLIIAALVLRGIRVLNLDAQQIHIRQKLIEKGKISFTRKAEQGSTKGICGGFVLEELFDHFQESSVSEITQQLNAKLLEGSKSNDKEYAKYNGTLSVLKKSRSNLVKAIESTGFNRTLGNKLKDVEKQIEGCEALLRQCEEKRDNMPVITEKQVREQLPKFNDHWGTTHREEVRLTVQKHIERVTVFPDRVEAAFKAAFNPGSGKAVTYSCKSSVSRYSFRKYGGVKVLEELETEKEGLCSA